MRITDLRPNHALSATRPQIKAVKNCAAVKLACRIPAWLAIAASDRSGSNHFSW